MADPKRVRVTFTGPEPVISPELGVISPGDELEVWDFEVADHPEKYKRKRSTKTAAERKGDEDAK